MTTTMSIIITIILVMITIVIIITTIIHACDSCYIKFMISASRRACYTGMRAGAYGRAGADGAHTWEQRYLRPISLLTSEIGRSIPFL